MSNRLKAQIGDRAKDLICWLNQIRIERGKSDSCSNRRDEIRLLRKCLELYEEFSASSIRNPLDECVEILEELRKVCELAFDKIGAQAFPAVAGLDQYDHNRYGPYLGISDEGGSGAAICDAAMSSPKALALVAPEPFQTGVALDAEMLGGAGESVVGPLEYRTVRLASMGRILTSTNVGTRVNVRYYRKAPFVNVNMKDIEAATQRAIELLTERFLPYHDTPNGHPRSLIVYIGFARTKASARPDSEMEAVLNALHKKACDGSICNPSVHQLGLFDFVDSGTEGVEQVKRTLNLAKKVGFKHVAIKGRIRRTAADRISVPGILNYFTETQTQSLLRHAKKLEINLISDNMVDVGAVARSIWSGLNTARNMGLELGKYGLYPLTIDESAKVIGQVQRWFPDWTPAPALYIDYPIVDAHSVYHGPSLVAGILAWLNMVAENGAKVVLIDTADKTNQQKLVRDKDAGNKGILTFDEIGQINSHASNKGLKVLWAGGLTLPQVYKMGHLGVFGIYVTSSAATQVAVDGAYIEDPALASRKKPTYEGVKRTILLLEAGFWYGLTNDKVLHSLVVDYLEGIRTNSTIEPIENRLSAMLFHLWKTSV